MKQDYTQGDWVLLPNEAGLYTGNLGLAKDEGGLYKTHVWAEQQADLW